MGTSVVILGAGYSGIGIAHKLLKYTKPKVEGLKVILVSPSTHHFWNLAAVRGVIEGEFQDDQLFQEIAPGFAKYGEDAFEFVVGSATGIDPEANCAHVKTPTGPVTINYSHLIIATGSSYPTRLPFTNIGSHEEMTAAWHSLQGEIRDAKSIVIAGSGPTGLETAGELASRFGQEKEITLVIERDLPLNGLASYVRKTAAYELEQLGINLIRDTRVTSATKAVGKMAIELSNGETLAADVYLPLYGMRPNTKFVPSELLDERGNVKLDKTLRVSGLQNVWGVGDIGNLETKQLIYAEKQTHFLASNLDAALQGHDNKVKDLTLAMTPQIFVTFGKKKGTGQYSFVQVPSIVVTTMKGPTLFSDKGPGLVAGHNICRSSI